MPKYQPGEFKLEEEIVQETAPVQEEVVVEAPQERSFLDMITGAISAAHQPEVTEDVNMHNEQIAKNYALPATSMVRALGGPDLSPDQEWRSEHPGVAAAANVAGMATTGGIPLKAVSAALRRSRISKGIDQYAKDRGAVEKRLLEKETKKIAANAKPRKGAVEGIEQRVADRLNQPTGKKVADYRQYVKDKEYNYRNPQTKRELDPGLDEAGKIPGAPQNLDRGLMDSLLGFLKRHPHIAASGMRSGPGR